jgi:hypothetical protein
MVGQTGDLAMPDGAHVLSIEIMRRAAAWMAAIAIVIRA